MEYWNYAKRPLRYLKGTEYLFVFVKFNVIFCLAGYIDCNSDQKSNK